MRWKRSHYHPLLRIRLLPYPRRRVSLVALTRRASRSSRRVDQEHKSDPWEDLLILRRTKRQSKYRWSGEEGRRALNRIMHVRSLGLIEHATITIPCGRRKKKSEKEKSCYRTARWNHIVYKSTGCSECPRNGSPGSEVCIYTLIKTLILYSPAPCADKKRKSCS